MTAPALPYGITPEDAAHPLWDTPTPRAKIYYRDGTSQLVFFTTGSYAAIHRARGSVVNKTDLAERQAWLAYIETSRDNPDIDVDTLRSMRKQKNPPGFIEWLDTVAFVGSVPSPDEAEAENPTQTPPPPSDE